MCCFCVFYVLFFYAACIALWSAGAVVKCSINKVNEWMNKTSYFILTLNPETKPFLHLLHNKTHTHRVPSRGQSSGRFTGCLGSAVPWYHVLLWAAVGSAGALVALLLQQDRSSRFPQLCQNLSHRTQHTGLKTTPTQLCQHDRPFTQTHTHTALKLLQCFCVALEIHTTISHCTSECSRKCLGYISPQNKKIYK